MNVVDGFLMVTVVVGALWWAFARGRFPPALAVLSLVSLGLAAVTLVAQGLHWQLVPWQVLAGAMAAAASVRWWRPGHSRRWNRVLGRVGLLAGVTLGGVGLLFVSVPVLPRPAAATGLRRSSWADRCASCWAKWECWRSLRSWTESDYADRAGHRYCGWLASRHIVISLLNAGDKRGPYTDRGIRTLLAVLGRRADVSHAHPHRFRHDTARRLVEHVDLPTVAALLGHSRLDTVRVYTQPDLQALERAAAILERAEPSPQ